MEIIPPPQGTNWLVASGNHIEILGNYPQLDNITQINLEGNQIGGVNPYFLEIILNSSTLKTLILSNNNISAIPKIITKLNFLHKIKLGENMFDCHCTMMWMTEWINNFLTKEGNRIIEDYAQVICYNSVREGKPIYQLSQQDFEEMGCIKDGALTMVQEVLLGTFGGLLVIMVTIIIVIGKMGGSEMAVVSTSQHTR